MALSPPVASLPPTCSSAPHLGWRGPTRCCYKGSSLRQASVRVGHRRRVTKTRRGSAFFREGEGHAPGRCPGYFTHVPLATTMQSFSLLCRARLGFQGATIEEGQGLTMSTSYYLTHLGCSRLLVGFVPVGIGASLTLSNVRFIATLYSPVRPQGPQCLAIKWARRAEGVRWHP